VKGATVDSTFDIFRRLPNGDPFWIAAVRGLKEAKEKMALEAQKFPGEYFIFLQGEGVVAKFTSTFEEQADAV
jgi:hypothetical protein